jgi:tetratricopeptide (TPR) repeat protein
LPSAYQAIRGSCGWPQERRAESGGSGRPSQRESQIERQMPPMFRYSAMRQCLVAGICLLNLAGAARTSGSSMFNAGIAASHRHAYDAAIPLLTIALEDAGLSAHQKAVALFERGTAYCETAQNNNAIADLTQAIRLEPGRVDSWRERAKAYARAGLSEQAIADETKAIQSSRTIRHCIRSGRCSIWIAIAGATR